MTAEELIYDIKILATKAGISDDLRDSLEDSFLLTLINRYRAISIFKYYRETSQVDPKWLQSLGMNKISCVSSNEDPDVPTSWLKMGKVTLPPVLTMPMNLGYYRIAAASGQEQFYVIDMNEFFELVQLRDERIDMYTFYYVVGNSLYFHPYKEQLSCVLILENPFDAKVYDTEIVQSGDLVVDQYYVVSNYAITHNGVHLYPDPAGFKATTTTYTGNGIVRNLNKERDMLPSDPYPIGTGLASEIVLSILTKELMIEKSAIADMTNDGEDETQILQKYGFNQSSKRA